MANQRPLLRLSELSNRVYLVTRYHERPGGVIEALAKVDVTNEVGAVLAELELRGLELQPSRSHGPLSGPLEPDPR